MVDVKILLSFFNSLSLEKLPYDTRRGHPAENSGFKGRPQKIEPGEKKKRLNEHQQLGRARKKPPKKRIRVAEKDRTRSFPVPLIFDKKIEKSKKIIQGIERNE